MATYDSSLPLADVDALQLRIGVDPIERLKWTLEFAEKDDTQLTAMDRDTLRWQLALFQETPIFWWDRLPTNYQVLREHFGRARQNLGRFDWQVPDDELMASVRKEFQKILRRLRAKREYVLSLKFHYLIMLGDSQTAPPEKRFRAPLYVERLSGSQMLAKAGTFQDKAVFKFAELLAGHPGSLRICAEEKCSRWFVDRKAAQTYCSPACQSRAATRRQRMAEKKGKR
jgi:hypothetical protein